MTSYRLLIIAGLAVVIFMSGCNKADPTSSTNLFGASPSIDEFNITRERVDFQCDEEDVNWCFFSFPPMVSVTRRIVSVDRITVTARVQDATGPDDILIAVLRFFDPPLIFNATETKQISLELFDDGSVPVSSIPVAGGTPIPVVSGDAADGDGVFSRVFYFATDTSVNAGTCKATVDQGMMGFTYSTYTTSRSDDPANPSGLPFEFHGEVIDNVGNIASTGTVIQEINGTFVDVSTIFTDTCPCEFGGPCP